MKDQKTPPTKDPKAMKDQKEKDKEKMKGAPTGKPNTPAGPPKR